MPARGCECLSSSGQLDNLMSERCERVRYRVEHEKIKFISISEYVIFYEFLVFKETVVLRRWERLNYIELRFRKLTFRALALRQSE